MNTILKFLFISQTLNTAIILMSVHANFENAHLPYIKQIFNGSYPDFTMEWYYKIGSIFSQTLIILGIMPAIDALFEFSLSRLKQFRDNRRLSKPRKGEELESLSKTKS